MQPTEQEPDPSGYDAFKQKLIDEMREPLLIAIEQEYSRLLRRENMVLSRMMYRRLKWEVVRAIVEGEE